MLGVVLMFLVTCAIRSVLGAAGVIVEERPVRYGLSAREYRHERYDVHLLIK